MKKKIALGISGLLLLLVPGLFFRAPLYLTWRNLKNEVELSRTGAEQREVRNWSYRFALRFHQQSEKPLNNESKTPLISSTATMCIHFVHGLGDESWTWKYFFKISAREWGTPVRLYAWDLPGHGRSQAREEGYLLSEIGRELLSRVNSVEEHCSQRVWVGNSLGAAVIAEALLQLQEDVPLNKAVWLAPGGMTQSSLQRAKTFFSSPTVQTLKEFQRKAYAQPTEIPEFLWPSLVNRLRQMPLEKWIQDQQSLTSESLSLRVRSLRNPILVLLGKSDQIVPEAETLEWILNLRMKRIESLSQCGHLPQKECPASVLKAIVSAIHWGSV